MARKIRVLVVHHANEVNKTMSYHHGWVSCFKTHPAFKSTFINLSGDSIRLSKIKTAYLRLNKPQFVIILHSTFANRNFLVGAWFDMVKALNVPAVYFAANEYKMMDEKRALAEDLNSLLFITQTDSPQVKEIYRKLMPDTCKVISMPHAGLDDKIFFPTSQLLEREIDIGYRASREPLYFGHNDRERMSSYFIKNADRFGLKTDINCGDPEKRFDRTGYAQFLNRCRGQLGTEAGTDIFEVDEGTRLKVNRYTAKFTNSTFADVKDKFFSNYTGDGVPLRMISGRNFEAAGTKTVQILFEGNYNNILVPDRHYIALKKDFSNIDDVISRFRDDEYCRNMVDECYKLVKNEYTYPRLLDRLAAEIRMLA